MRRFGLWELLLVALVAGASGALLALWAAPRAGGRGPTPADWAADAPESGPIGIASMADAAARSAPSVVSIFAFHGPQPADQRIPSAYGAPARQGRPETGLGSGVVLTADGVILTNRHVVKDAERILAVLPDGRRLPARVLGVDTETDLAVLKAEATGLPSVPVGNPKALRVGDLTLAIGNPYGVGQTVTQGIVSATGREELGITPIEGFIQTDAAINPGNSGGALVNARGELIGINTAIYSESGSSDGIGFAIPSDRALKVARAILEQGRVDRGWIGMSGRSVTPQLIQSFGLRALRGVLVSSTLEQSPAEKAGLRPGDVVTRVGDTSVATVQELQDAIAGLGPDRPVSLEVWRGSERLRAQAVTGSRPAGGQ